MRGSRSTPKGLLSTLPAIVTFIIGYLTGGFLDRTKDRRYALAELFPAALALIAAGFLWDYWFGFPINKKLWTSSYTLYAGGWSLLALATVVWAADVHGRTRVLSFFNIFGRNPLLAYLSSEGPGGGVLPGEARRAGRHAAVRIHVALPAPRRGPGG